MTAPRPVYRIASDTDMYDDDPLAGDARDIPDVDSLDVAIEMAKGLARIGVGKTFRRHVGWVVYACRPDGTARIEAQGLVYR